MTRVFILYALSGFISLGYQVGWFRILTDWFGSTNLTFVVVVCSFIGGLGVGSLLSKKITHGLSEVLRIRDGLRLYGLIEIIVAASALLTPLAEFIPADLWGVFPYALHEGIWFQSPAYQASQVFIAIACVFVPCFFMGATFPLLCHVFSGSERGDRFPSSLYAWNTLGACSGVLACQFVLILWIGHVPMFWLMAGLNMVLGFYFFATGGAPQTPASEIASENVTARTSAEITLGKGKPLYGSLILFAVISGFLSGALEGDLFKRLSFIIPLNPGSMMSFISFWVIAAIFFGSSIVRFSKRINLAAIKVGLFLALGYYMIVWWTGDSIMFAMSPPALRDSFHIFPDTMFKLFLFTGIYAFPPYLFVSLLLPYTCNKIQAQGKHLGLAYGLNTVAFCAGMIMFTQVATRVNIFYSLKLFMLLMGLVAVSLIFLFEFKRLAHWKAATILSAFGLICLLTPADFDKNFFPPSHFPHKLPVNTMMSNGANTTFVVNMSDEMDNKRLFFGRLSMSGTSFTNSTYMRLMAHFPMLAHKDPKRALLICFGVGNTASAISKHDMIEQIDVVDLNDKVFRTAPQFAATHSNVHLDPRVRLINDDGRNFLRITGETYDLITSEPPPPMHASVYRLYSREYYESVLEHLTPGGFMTQWFPFQQIPREAEGMIVSTFISVFPHTMLIKGTNYNPILIGSPSPIDLGRIRKRFFDSGKVVDDLNRMGIHTSAGLTERIILSDQELREQYGDKKVISDQHNDLEHLVQNEQEQLERRFRTEL